MPADEPDVESTSALFQQSPRCRPPFQILAVPELCFQDCQTICDGPAEKRTMSYCLHALQEC